MRTRKMQRSWFLLLASLLAVGSCGEQPSDEAALGKRTAALSTPVPCELGRLPSTDPNKPTTATCVQPPAPAPSSMLITAQQAYLAEWQKQAPSWAGLSAAEKEERRRKLKESFLGKPGGQP